jgi:hypothetical protein
MPEKSPSTPTTARDILDEFISRFGNPSGQWTEGQNQLWNKLIGLGDRSAHLVHQVPDIDAATELSPEEVAELREEIAKL